MKFKLNQEKELELKGVYKITNIVNNKFYIGSTSVTFKGRLKDHLSQLRRGIHTNIYLQEDWNIFGEDSFEFSIIKILESSEEILNCEQKYITETNCCNRNLGYNIDPEVHRIIRSEETCKKISNTLKEGYATGRIVASHHECVFKGKKRPEFSQKMRGKKCSIQISDLNGNIIAIFRGQLDIQEFTINNKIPGTTLGPHSAKGYYISKKMVAKYVDTGKPYKGLLFTRTLPLSPEMGIVKWVNCENGEIPNSQPSFSLTTDEGSTTNS